MPELELEIDKTYAAKSKHETSHLRLNLTGREKPLILIVNNEGKERRIILVASDSDILITSDDS